MSKNETLLNPRCPIRTTLEMLGGKWSLLILNTLNRGGVLRYRDLSNSIPEISDKVLSKELRSLEENHLIRRQVEGGQNVQYELSEIGKKAADLLEPISEFGHAYHSFLEDLYT